MNGLSLILSILAFIFSGIAAWWALTSYFREKERDIEFDIGFSRGDGVSNQAEAKAGSSQRAYFRIMNRSSFAVKSLECILVFPSTFQHPNEKDPNALTTNSTLGAARYLIQIPDGRSQLAGILPGLLGGHSKHDFWIRFKPPEEPQTYTLEMRVDAVGVKSKSTVLTLTTT